MGGVLTGQSAEPGLVALGDDCDEGELGLGADGNGRHDAGEQCHRRKDAAGKHDEDADVYL